LVILLAGVHVTDRNRRRAYAVAGHLIKAVLKERWHRLSEHQRQILIKESGNRLWNGYMEKRRNEVIKPKEAAQDAIFDETSVLEQLLNPNNTKSGLLGQVSLLRQSRSLAFGLDKLDKLVIMYHN
jgi:hypothetical protein